MRFRRGGRLAFPPKKKKTTPTSTDGVVFFGCFFFLLQVGRGASLIDDRQSLRPEEAPSIATHTHTHTHTHTDTLTHPQTHLTRSSKHTKTQHLAEYRRLFFVNGTVRRLIRGRARGFKGEDEGRHHPLLSHLLLFSSASPFHLGLRFSSIDGRRDARALLFFRCGRRRSSFLFFFFHFTSEEVWPSPISRSTSSWLSAIATTLWHQIFFFDLFFFFNPNRISARRNHRPLYSAASFHSSS